MTEHALFIAFSKETGPITPVSRVGVDLNEKSAVLSDGTTYDLSKVARLHTEYGARRGDFHFRHPHDQRLTRKFSSRSREKERAKQYLHSVSKQIVQKAVESKQAIILERLVGIRYSHQKGNRESKGSRRRIAQWPFRQLQNQIENKATWNGLPVEYVSAAGTSKKCHNCGLINRMLKLNERVAMPLWCHAKPRPQRRD